MSLRFAILGYLTTAPGTGYDLMQQFDTGLGWFWTARHSQIYPELHRLAAAGLVQREATRIGENVDKFIYTITDAGRAELREWVVQPPKYPPNRDDERLRLIFADESPEALRAHFTAHLHHFRQRRQHLSEMLALIVADAHPRINVRLAGRSPSAARLTRGLRELAYSGDIARAELEIEWAESGLVWLDKINQS